MALSETAFIREPRVTPASNRDNASPGSPNSRSRRPSILLIPKPYGKRIAIVNVASDDNRGACALTWASIEFVLEAFQDASIAIIPVAETPPSADPFRHTRRRYPDVKILPPLFDGRGRTVIPLLGLLARSIRKVLAFDLEHVNPDPTLEWLRNCDLVVSVGGVTFETLHGTFRDDARLLIRCLPLLAAKKIDLDAILVGAQVGPFNTVIGRRLFGRIESAAAAVFPRDRVSAAEARLAGGARQIVLPDSALSLVLPLEVPFRLLAEHGIDPASSILALVISSALRPEETRRSHVLLLAQVAAKLLASGFVNEILVVVQADEDRAISLDLLKTLELDPRYLIAGDLNPEELSSLYSACRMVVASRLHAVILSLLAGVPAISLAPEVTFKEHSVLEIVGLESLCVPTRLGPERVSEVCLAVASDEELYRESIVTAVAAARAALKEVPHVMRETVQKRV